MMICCRCPINTQCYGIFELALHNSMYIKGLEKHRHELGCAGHIERVAITHTTHPELGCVPPPVGPPSAGPCRGAAPGSALSSYVMLSRGRATAETCPMLSPARASLHVINTPNNNNILLQRSGGEG